MNASMSSAVETFAFPETKASPALKPIIECRAWRRLDTTSLVLAISLHSIVDASISVFFNCNPRLVNRELLLPRWWVDKQSDELVENDETVSNFINEKCLMIVWLLLIVYLFLWWWLFTNSGMSDESKCNNNDDHAALEKVWRHRYQSASIPVRYLFNYILPENRHRCQTEGNLSGHHRRH